MANQAKSAARRRLEKREKAQQGGPRVVNLPEGVGFFKPESDDPKRLDILEYEVTQKGNPYAKPGETYFERTYFRHGNLGPEGKGMCVCLKKTYGEACPVCEYLKTVNWDDEAEKDVAKQMNAKERQLFNVYDVAEGETKVWEVSYHIFGKQLDGELANADEEDEVDSFYSIKQDVGKTLKVAFTEKKIGKTVYYEASSINFKKRATDHADEGTAVYDLDAMISHPSYDDVKALMDGKPVSEEKAEKVETKAAAPEQKEAPSEDGVFECPGGGEYGKDVDKFGKTCEKCPQWNDCDDLTNP